MAFASVAALSFAPGLGMQPPLMPALGHAAARVQTPAMLDFGTLSSYIADTAPVLMPDAASSAANAASAAAEQEPGFFDMCATRPACTRTTPALAAPAGFAVIFFRLHERARALAPCCHT